MLDSSNRNLGDHFAFVHRVFTVMDLMVLHFDHLFHDIQIGQTSFAAFSSQYCSSSDTDGGEDSGERVSQHCGGILVFE